MEEQTTKLVEQNGFRAERSCIYGTFTLKYLTEQRVETLHLTFIDFTSLLCGFIK